MLTPHFVPGESVPVLSFPTCSLDHAAAAEHTLRLLTGIVQDQSCRWRLFLSTGTHRSLMTIHLGSIRRSLPENWNSHAIWTSMSSKLRTLGQCLITPKIDNCLWYIHCLMQELLLFANNDSYSSKHQKAGFYSSSCRRGNNRSGSTKRKNIYIDVVWK